MVCAVILYVGIRRFNSFGCYVIHRIVKRWSKLQTTDTISCVVRLLGGIRRRCPYGHRGRFFGGGVVRYAHHPPPTPKKNSRMRQTD